MRLFSLTIAVFIAIFFVGCNSSGSSEKAFGEYELRSSNVKGDRWIKSNFAKSFEQTDIIDSSLISIRVSRKVVMTGFNKADDTTGGAFEDMLEIFSGFRQHPHNTNGNFEYRFFDGDSEGKLSNTVSRSELFNQSQYTSASNNLHFQFQNIAQEIVNDTVDNKFYVIFSDGETTIRKEKNNNADELILLKDATKAVIQNNPSIQIGLLSLIADFNGSYSYDIGKVEQINCQRYLYAICFFDKKFLPEFNRFCQLNKRLGGKNFLFNPQFDFSHYTPHYLTGKIEGQDNVSVSPFYAAYPVEMTGQTIEVEYKNKINLPFISLPMNIKREVYLYIQKDSLQFIQSHLIDSAIAEIAENQKIVISNLKQSCIVKADLLVDFDIPIERMVASEILKQDIYDNRLEEINLIKNSETAITLKTEGLKDMMEMILQALQESSKSVVLTNFFQFGKD